MSNTPSFPLSDYLEMAVDDEGGGKATARVDAGAQHHNPHGFVHGAVLAAMVDTSMGAALMGLLNADQRCSTIELHLRFLRPAVSGPLTAETTVIKHGRRIAHLESSVTEPSGRVIATATASFAIIDEPPPQPGGG